MKSPQSATEWLAARYVVGFSAAQKQIVEPRVFRALGFDAARRLGGKFVDDHRPGICKNHEIGVLTVRASATRILLHHDLPLVAFANHHVDGEGYGGYDFIDVPALADIFEQTLVVVDQRTLDKPIDMRALEHAVGKDRDIAHWNPRRVGDVFFNFWD